MVSQNRIAAPFASFSTAILPLTLGWSVFFAIVDRPMIVKKLSRLSRAFEDNVWTAKSSLPFGLFGEDFRKDT